MADPGLRVEPQDDGRIVRLVIDRPARGNSLDAPLLEAVERALGEAERAGARAAILTGEGEKSFSTGYDIEALVAELSSGRSVQDLEGHPLERALRAIDGSALPVIAAVNGAAFGAAFEIATACDFRLAVASARFVMPPARLGLLYSHTGLARFLHVVGLPATKRIFLAAEPVDAGAALALGLVQAVLEDRAALDAGALALARRLAANAPLAVAATKRVLHRHLLPPRLSPEEEREIADLRGVLFASQDLAEGLAAALEKREPRFEGR